MATIKDIINSPLLLALVCGGLLYITAFSVVYLLKARQRALEMGITAKEISDIIKSSLIFSVVPSLSIVIGLVALAASLGTVWAWWRLSVIGSLSFETQIASNLAPTMDLVLHRADGEGFRRAVRCCYDPDVPRYAGWLCHPAALRQEADDLR